MKYVYAIISLSISLVVHGAETAKAETASAAVVYREPFTLKLHIDKDRYYEEKFKKNIPYVENNDVYLFAGESFGINLEIKDGEITSVAYQKEADTADVALEFKQEIKDDGSSFMWLVLQSNVEQTIYLDALMTIPGKKGFYKTGILPLYPKLGGNESWPHPIVQLVLRNFRLKK